MKWLLEITAPSELQHVEGVGENSKPGILWEKRNPWEALRQPVFQICLCLKARQSSLKNANYRLVENGEVLKPTDSLWDSDLPLQIQNLCVTLSVTEV